MNLKYDAAREGFGGGDLSWTRDSIVAQLVSAAYVPDPGHRDAGALVRGAIGEPVELVGRTIPGGWAQCGEIVFRQASGPDAVAMVIRRDSAEKSLSTLICYLDEIDKFPMKLNGGDVHVAIPERGLFRI